MPQGPPFDPEFGHYRVFQRPKYISRWEHAFFWPSLFLLLAGLIWLFAAI